jgi:aspartate/glutamate racemase
MVGGLSTLGGKPMSESEIIARGRIEKVRETEMAIVIIGCTTVALFLHTPFPTFDNQRSILLWYH